MNVLSILGGLEWVFGRKEIVSLSNGEDDNFIILNSKLEILESSVVINCLRDSIMLKNFKKIVAIYF